MPVFDGAPIKPGDELYDINDGTLKVFQVHSDRVQLTKPGAGTRTYSYAGVKSGKNMRTLYWQNPIMVIPPKDKAVWRKQKELVAGVMPVLGPMAADIIEDESQLDDELGPFIR